MKTLVTPLNVVRDIKEAAKNPEREKEVFHVYLSNTYHDETLVDRAMGDLNKLGGHQMDRLAAKKVLELKNRIYEIEEIINKIATGKFVVLHDLNYPKLEEPRGSYDKKFTAENTCES